MGKTNYNALLNDKVMAEYEDFITELKGKSAEEIIQRAYEKVTKEVMMLLCDDLKLEQKEARALHRFYLYKPFWIAAAPSYIE